MKKILSLMVAVALCLTMAVGAFAEAADPGYTTFEFADTTGGRIRGYRYNGVYTFMGIPYAQADRFEEPQDTSWEGTLDCATPGPISPQYTAYHVQRYQAGQVYQGHWRECGSRPPERSEHYPLQDHEGKPLETRLQKCRWGPCAPRHYVCGDDDLLFCQ